MNAFTIYLRCTTFMVTNPDAYKCTAMGVKYTFHMKDIVGHGSTG